MQELTEEQLWLLCEEYEKDVEQKKSQAKVLTDEELDYYIEECVRLDIEEFVPKLMQLKRDRTINKLLKNDE